MLVRLALADLKFYREYKSLISDCNKQLEKIAMRKERLCEARSPTWSDEPKVRPIRSWESFLVDLLSDERTLKERIDNYQRKIDEMDIMIASIDGEPRLLIIDKYVNGLSWAQMMEKYSYTRQSMDKQIRQAIKRVVMPPLSS